MKNKKAIFARIDKKFQTDADAKNAVTEPVDNAMMALLDAIDAAKNSGLLTDEQTAAYQKIYLAICTM